MLQSQQRNMNRYPDRSKDFINFTILPWFNNRYHEVILEGNPVRVARYKLIDPLQLVIEYPRVIFREEGYFRSTISARAGSLCFPDPKIRFVGYERFLSHIDQYQRLYENPHIPTELTRDTLLEYVRSQSSLPTTPTYYLTTIKDEPNTYALLILSQSPIDIEAIADTVTGRYKFQRVSFTTYNKDDDEYPRLPSESLEGYISGYGKIEELLLKEQYVRFLLFDVKAIQDIDQQPSTDAYYNGVYTYNGEITY